VKEICIYGRGGQGSLVLAQFMAIAALEDGKYGQAFPFLGGGGERRGKPIMAFCRLSDRPIRIRSRIGEADYLIVQDATIMEEEDVSGKVRPGGTVLVNTEKPPGTLGLKKNVRLHVFPAEKMAREILGRPIMNTALLGAFGAVTNELTLNALLRAVQKKFPGEMGEKNAKVVEQSYKALIRGGAR